MLCLSGLLLTLVAADTDSCVLSAPARLWPRAQQEGTSKPLALGITLIVHERRKKFWRVVADGQAGFVPAAVLERHCVTAVTAVEVPAVSPVSPPDAKPEPAEYAAHVAQEPLVTPFGETDKIKVVVMDLRAAADFPSDFVASMTALISQELDLLGVFKAISKQDIEQMLALESMKDALGCDSAVCLAEIGGALGADYLVAGSLTLVGQTHLLQLQLTNSRESKVAARAMREHQGSLQGLLDEVRIATKLLVRDLLNERSGTLALSVNREGATVRIDGSIVGASPLAPQTVAGGMHTVQVDQEGYVRFLKDVQITPQGTTLVRAVLVPSPELLRTIAAQAARARLLMWTGGILGMLSTGGASYIYVWNSQRASHFDGTAAMKGSIATWDGFALGLAGTAVVGLSVAVYSYLTIPDTEEAQP